MDTLWTVAFCLSVAAGDDLGLAPEKLYHGVGRPVMVTVASLRATRNVTLVLMDGGGQLIVPPRAVIPGRVDLGGVLPEIWSLRRTCYVQRMDDERPVGSALVVQPLLEHAPPRIEQAVRSDGTTYTRIVGWGPAPGQEADAPPGTDEAPTPVFSGLRIYPERDVVLVTSKGDIVLAMRPDEAPNTVWNFLHLVEGGFYDGVVFHRILPLTRRGHPFVIQAGDPGGTGDGGPGYWLPLEPSGLAHDFGVVSMARGDHPDSAGSQFFICLSREGTAHLDGQYCAFSYAVSGDKAIRALASVPLADAAAGRPGDPPMIQWAELIPAPRRVPGEGRPDAPIFELRPVAETQPERVPR